MADKFAMLLQDWNGASRSAGAANKPHRTRTSNACRESGRGTVASLPRLSRRRCRLGVQAHQPRDQRAVEGGAGAGGRTR